MHANRTLHKMVVGFAVLFGVVKPASATILNSASSMGAFFTSDDSERHAIVADTGGNVYEVYWQNTSSVSKTPIASFSGITAVSGHYTSFDGYRHAIVALNNSSTGNVEIHEVYYQSCCGPYSDTLLTFSRSYWGTVVGLSSFVSSDNAEHVVFALSGGTVSGSVWDYRYDSYVGTPVEDELGTFTAGSIIDVAAYQAHDGYHHAIVAHSGTNGSGLTEFYYTNSNIYSDLLNGGIGSNISSIGAGDSWGYDSGYANTVYVGEDNYYNSEFFEYGTSGQQLNDSYHLGETIQSVSALQQFNNSSRISVVDTTSGHLFQCTPSGSTQSCTQLSGISI